MKKYTMKVVFCAGILSSLLLLPITSLAIDTYSTETGYLSIPEVQVDGKAFYENVGLKLNFATGTFEFVSGNERPETGTNLNPGGISSTILESDENESVKLDFMGCERWGDSGVTCHVNFTSLGGLDREVKIGAGTSFTSLNSKVYDSNGALHYAVKGSIANVKTHHISGTATVLLIANVPTLAKFKFANISPERSLSLFKPSFKIYDEWWTSSFHKF